MPGKSGAELVSEQRKGSGHECLAPTERRCRARSVATLLVLTAVQALGAQQAVSSAAVSLVEKQPPSVQEGVDAKEAESEQIAAFDRDIERGELESAKDLVTSYLKTHPNSWQAHYQLGYVLFRLHDIHGSIATLAKSLELNIRNAEAHKVLGLDFTIIDRYDLAEVEFKQAVSSEPDSAEIHYFLGRVYYTSGNYPLARKEFETAVRLNPTYMKAYANLGLALEGLEENSAALDNYMKAIQLDTEQNLNSEWPYIDLASFYGRQGKPQLALNYSRQAIEINPNSAQAYVQVAKACESLKEWGGAAQALEKAIAIEPNSARPHYVLSYVYRMMGKSKESQQEIEAFEKLQKQDTSPENSTGGPVSPSYQPPTGSPN